MKALAGKKPRRFKDHRRKVARRWSEDYDAIAERYPPRDRLGRELIAITADQLTDYKALRRSKRATPSALRKTAGLVLGALRAVADGGGNGHQEPKLDLAAELARQGMGT